MCIACLGAVFVCVCLGFVCQELGSCSEISVLCLCVFCTVDRISMHNSFSVCDYIWYRKHMCTMLGVCVSTQFLGECNLCRQVRLECNWRCVQMDMEFPCTQHVPETIARANP